MDTVEHYKKVMGKEPDFEFISGVKAAGFAWFMGQDKSNTAEMLFDKGLEPLFVFVVGYEVSHDFTGNSLQFSELVVNNDCTIATPAFNATFNHNFRVQCSNYFAEEYLLK